MGYSPGQSRPCASRLFDVGGLELIHLRFWHQQPALVTKAGAGDEGW
jgi:hypothetical protein